MLGGSYIALLPGGSPDPLQDEDVIIDTQGSVDMVGMIGSLINDSGSAGAGGQSGGDGFDTMSDDFADPDTP